MKILLAFPPFHPPTSPPLGIATLKGSLARTNPVVEVLPYAVALGRVIHENLGIPVILGGTMMSHLDPDRRRRCGRVGISSRYGGKTVSL